MSAITYHEQPPHRQDACPITVKLEGRVVGKIVRVPGGYRYRPKGARQEGNTFADLDALKADLSGEVA